MSAKFYLVGGAVRDELLGKPSKDKDFTVEAESYAAMKQAVLDRGGEIFPIPNSEAFLTIRAKVPGIGAADFVLARKDSTYSDGRRPDFVVVGTLHDDLARRDFTVNAMARAEDGTLVDPFNGQEDLANKLLRCVGNTNKRMHEDALRALRAIRFSITKGFAFAADLRSYLLSQDAADNLANVSANRIRDELFRCFEHNTMETLNVLDGFWRIRRHVFEREIKLVPTIFTK